MAGESSASTSKSTSLDGDNKNLLKFYQKEFEEYQRKDDKYKEKVDKHLKNLICDRHELEKEVLRRGEKISDLQKALVELQLSVFEEREKFLKVSAENEELKKNEVQLHDSIRQLLAMTRQKDLRDKIIYILKNPKVEVGYRKERPLKSEFSDSNLVINEKLKEELEHLQNQLDEVLRISKSKADIVLNDCKTALKKSKEKIMQDEILIRELQKKIHDINIQDKGQATKTSSASRSASADTKLSRNRSEFEPSSYESYRKNKEGSSQTSAAEAKSTAVDFDFSQHIAESDPSVNISSQLKDIHLSFILLLKIVSKITNILNSIQATKVYQRIANIPKVPSAMQDYVDDSSIVQLETYLRQCTRLTYDINNMHKTLNKYVSTVKRKVQNVNALKSEIKYLEELLTEMAVNTADADLLNVDLKRSNFFAVLRGTTDAFQGDRLHHVADFLKIVTNCDTLRKLVSKSIDFVENVIQTYSTKSYHVETSELRKESSTSSVESQKESLKRLPEKSKQRETSVKLDKSESTNDLEKLLGIYKRTMQEAENLGLGLSAETKLLSEKFKATQKKLQEDEKLKKCDDNFRDEIMRPELSHSEPILSHSDSILRKIDKTLTKVEQMECGEYFKEEKLCRKLAENVDALTKKFKELTEEFNIKSVQDQFSEYSVLTLEKLEELARQSRNSVIAAEAQIAAHRSNAKQLSQKLKDTEELLRESINECLSLKQKIKRAEEKREMDKYALIASLREKLDNMSNLDELEGIINQLVNFVAEDKSTKITPDPYVCIYCRQGAGHKLCQEKINDLRAEDRKSRTLLKHCQQEMKQERETLKVHKEVAEKAAADLAKKNEGLKEAVQSLESRNSSLLEQLKMEKNRVKNMERFRRLEIEGFQTDIRNLKSKIKDMEKQLLKAVMIFENNKKDMELLKTVHETAQRSKQATSALRRLKAKLYELENDIKNL